MTNCIDMAGKIAGQVYVEVEPTLTYVKGRIYAILNDAKTWFDHTAIVCKVGDAVLSVRKDCLGKDLPEAAAPFGKILSQVKWYNAATSLPGLVDTVYEKWLNFRTGTKEVAEGTRTEVTLSADKQVTTRTETKVPARVENLSLYERSVALIDVIGLGSGALSKLHDILNPYYGEIKKSYDGLDVGFVQVCSRVNLAVGSVFRGLAQILQVREHGFSKKGYCAALNVGDALGGLATASLLLNPYSSVVFQSQALAVSSLFSSACKLSSWAGGDKARYW